MNIDVRISNLLTVKHGKMDISFNKQFLAAGLLLTAFNAEAALTNYTSDSQSLVYSSISNITWTEDANLLSTMIGNMGYNNTVNAIIDSYDSSYSISAADFSNTLPGRTTWFGAKAFVGYLNSINYAGSNEWVLPSAGANPQSGYNQTDGQFGQLFYEELNGTAYSNIQNTENFSNEQVYAYWLAEESSPYSWDFATTNGIQALNSKDHKYYVWAVSPGQVSQVPVPATIWLFGSGLLGLIGVIRR